jgi:hypothetical protein
MINFLYIYKTLKFINNYRDAQKHRQNIKIIIFLYPKFEIIFTISYAKYIKYLKLFYSRYLQI